MLNVQYVTDSHGKPLYVRVPVKEYEKLLASIEGLADITAYKKAKRKQERPCRLTKHSVKLKHIIVNRVHNV